MKTSWELERIENQIRSLEKVVKRYEESVENLTFFKKHLKEHGIEVDVDDALGFSPDRTLQIAKSDIARAKEALKNYERFGRGRYPIRYERMVEEIRSIIPERRKAVESNLYFTEELHNILEDVYGREAAYAYEEAQEEQLLVHTQVNPF